VNKLVNNPFADLPRPRYSGVVRIATRKSALALWQAAWVRERLAALGAEVKLVPLDTQGDRTQQAGTPFRLMPGQGFFTKAVQDAVLEGRADVAVHSHKDLPSARLAGLELAAVTEREDPRDVLLVRPSAVSPESAALPLRAGAVVGTSAARRQAQLRHLRPDVRVAELRGNVPTRVRALREGRYDAVVLAAAGLARLALDLGDLAVYPLDPQQFVPAPAQGALALEVRQEDVELAALLTELHAPDAYKTVAAERGLMGMLQGGCQLALGAYAALRGGEVELTAWYEGKRVSVQHPTAEGAAYLAFDALGRPAPAQVAAAASKGG
jgi:hydroxymethylbilane synthase